MEDGKIRLDDSRNIAMSQGASYRDLYLDGVKARLYSPDDGGSEGDADVIPDTSDIEVPDDALEACSSSDEDYIVPFKNQSCIRFVRYRFRYPYYQLYYRVPLPSLPDV